jgi:integrase
VNTGLRRGEALALHWADIDFDEKLLRVRGTLAPVAGELVVTETKIRGLAEWSPFPPLRSGCCAMYARQSAGRAAEGGLNVATDAVRVYHRAG